MTSEEERELDLQLGDMIRENHILKQRLEAAVTEAFDCASAFFGS